MAIRDNTDRVNELIDKINSLPVAGSGGSGNDGEDGFSPTISVEETSGGHNIVITDVNGTKSFFVPDGKDGTDGYDGTDGVGISSVEQTTTSNVDSGSNIITVTLSNGRSSMFTVKNGSTGSSGDDGVGISEISQTTSSSTDGGINVITISLTNGKTYTVNVKNGSKGDPGDIGKTGPAGSDATINGLNTLIIDTETGITKTQSGSTMTLGGDLNGMLAAGNMILSSYQYGDTLPSPGVTGRVFFKKVGS